MQPYVERELIKTARHVLKCIAFVAAVYVLTELAVMWASP
jgi:hypothetical protein